MYVLEDGLFVEIEADHFGHVGINDLVVGNAASWRVCHRDLSCSPGAPGCGVGAVDKVNMGCAI